MSRKGLVGKNHRKKLRTIKSSLQTTSFFIYADSNQDIYIFFTIKNKNKSKNKDLLSCIQSDSVDINFIGKRDSFDWPMNHYYSSSRYIPTLPG